MDFANKHIELFHISVHSNFDRGNRDAITQDSAVILSDPLGRALTGVVIAGATWGTDTLGNNWFGNFVDFWNPLSDMQEAADITDALTDPDFEAEFESEEPSQLKVFEPSGTCTLEEELCEQWQEATRRLQRRLHQEGHPPVFE